MMYVRATIIITKTAGEKTAFADRAVPNLASLRFGFFSCVSYGTRVSGRRDEVFLRQNGRRGNFFLPRPDDERGPKIRFAAERNGTRDGPVRQYRHFIYRRVLSLPLVIVRRGQHYHRTQASRESGRASGRLWRVRARKVHAAGE